MSYGDDPNLRTTDELRVAAKARGRQLRRHRRLMVGSGISAAVVVGVTVGIISASPGPSSSSVAVTAPATSPTVPVPAGEAILALTMSGNLEELSYPSGRVIQQVAGPQELRRCYGPTSPCGTYAGQPTLGASLTYSQQSQTAYVSLGQEIDSYPLNGSQPMYVTQGWDPSVSPNGQTLAFQPEPGAELGKAVIGLRDLATGTTRNVVIPAATVATHAGLPLPTTAEDTITDGLSWAPDSRHLAVTISMSFGLNAANTIGTTFFEVVILDTQSPLSATNPAFVGPAAGSMTDLRSPSDGKGWAQAVWDQHTGQLVVLHPTSTGLNDHCFGDAAAEPMNLAMVNPNNGSSSNVQLSQPPYTARVSTFACPGTLLSIDSSGRLLLIGKGLPRLEEWNTQSTSTTLTLLGSEITAAAWIR